MNEYITFKFKIKYVRETMESNELVTKVRTKEEIQKEREERERIKKLTAGLVIVNGKAVKFSTRLKYYGKELAEVMICSKAIFNPEKIVVASSQHGRKKKELEENKILEVAENVDEVKNDSLERSKRRARKKVFDYAMCNPDLDVFITFTLDGNKIDRYDYKSVIKKLNVWLDNRVRRNGLKYIFVAEHHKDGAIHFHGVVNRKAIKLVDSGKLDAGGHKVFNVKDWELGFSTAIECYGDRASVCKYITKYITKSGEKVGGRWYYSGGDLLEPEFEYLGKTTPEDWKNLTGFEIYTKRVEEIGVEFNIISRKW